MAMVVAVRAARLGIPLPPHQSHRRAQFVHALEHGERRQGHGVDAEVGGSQQPGEEQTEGERPHPANQAVGQAPGEAAPRLHADGALVDPMGARCHRSRCHRYRCRRSRIPPGRCNRKGGGGDVPLADDPSEGGSSGCRGHGRTRRGTSRPWFPLRPEHSPGECQNRLKMAPTGEMSQPPHGLNESDDTYLRRHPPGRVGPTFGGT